MKNLTLDRYHKYIALITINNPEKQNAFDAEILNELSVKLKTIKKDKSFRIVYIIGTGNKSFSSGVFLKDLIEFKDATEAKNYASLLESTMDELYNLPKPVIALINGYAIGGGFGLAMSSDIRIMTQDAKIGFPAVKIGAILPPGCTYRLISLIGAGHTKELLLTGRYVSSDQALSMGMVHYLVKDRNELFKKADEISKLIIEGSDTALAITKATINEHTNELIYRYNLYSSDNFAYLFTTRGWHDRIHKFLNRKNSTKG